MDFPGRISLSPATSLAFAVLFGVRPSFCNWKSNRSIEFWDKVQTSWPWPTFCEGSRGHGHQGEKPAPSNLTPPAWWRVRMPHTHTQTPTYITTPRQRYCVPKINKHSSADWPGSAAALYKCLADTNPPEYVDRHSLPPTGYLCPLQTSPEKMHKPAHPMVQKWANIPILASILRPCSNGGRGILEPTTLFLNVKFSHKLANNGHFMRHYM